MLNSKISYHFFLTSSHLNKIWKQIVTVDPEKDWRCIESENLKSIGSLQSSELSSSSFNKLISHFFANSWEANVKLVRWSLRLIVVFFIGNGIKSSPGNGGKKMRTYLNYGNDLLVLIESIWCIIIKIIICIFISLSSQAFLCFFFLFTL